MASGSYNAPRLLPRVLLRVLPLAVLVLFTTWYGVDRAIRADVQSELIEKLDQEAKYGASAIASKLDTLTESIHAVASNDLIVNSLLDRASRETYVPTYMQSLRLPGPDGVKISFVDYRGRLIASNQNDPSAADYFVSKSSISGSYLQLDPGGATFAVPVLYSGRQEGAIVVRYNTLQLHQLLSVNDYSHVTNVAMVFHGDRLLYSSDWTLSAPNVSGRKFESDGYTNRSTELPGYGDLTFVVATRTDKAFATANRVERLMLLVIGIALLALVAGIVITAFLATKPLVAFAEEMKSIGSADDLDRRLHLTGIHEFDRLSKTFNKMLRRMQKVLVSHELLDRENRARKQAEYALRESEKRYRDMIEGSLRGIYIYKGNRLLFANPAFAAVFGYDDPKRLIAEKRLSDLYDAEAAAAMHKLDGAPQRTVLQQEICLKAEDGSEKWYENVSCVTDWEGQEAVQASLTDITERREVERLKSDFVSIVSHELRTPLTSVTGSLGLIQSGALGKLPEKVEPLIAIAHTNTQRLVALVNDILDVQKIEAGHMEFHMKPVDVSELCAQALSETAFFGAKHGVSFEFEKEVDGAYVSGDKFRLIQVLTNLLSNAAKFSLKGATVTVKLSGDDDTVRISVIDQGQGIPADKLEGIFEKFKQADSSDSRAKAGTGLGLSICQSIAEKHGTKIKVKSVEGEGSEFYFDLTRIAAPAQAGGKEAHADDPKIAV